MIWISSQFDDHPRHTDVLYDEERSFTVIVCDIDIASLLYEVSEDVWVVPRSGGVKRRVSVVV